MSNRGPTAGAAEHRRKGAEIGLSAQSPAVGTIKGVARKFGVHRRMVRDAIGNAVPPPRKIPGRDKPKLAPVHYTGFLRWFWLALRTWSAW